MSENPYTMNSLGPVWQQGYDAGQAALQSQLEPGPCGVEGHLVKHWVNLTLEESMKGGPGIYHSLVGMCIACRAVQEAAEAERQSCIEAVQLCHPDSGFFEIIEAIKKLGPTTALSDAARRARLDALMEVAKVLCEGCSHGVPLDRTHGFFKHEYGGGIQTCGAHAIHRLAELRRIP